MHRRAVLVGAFLGFFLTSPSPAQSPAPASAHVQLPKGIAGFLDPATKNFLPLGGDAAPAGQTVSGVGHIGIEYDIKFGPLDSIDCTITLVFGNLAGTPPAFFSNHSAQVSFNAQASAAPRQVAIPFSYTPNGNGKPDLQINTECTVIDAFGNTSTGKSTVFPGFPAGSFNTDVTVAVG